MILKAFFIGFAVFIILYTLLLFSIYNDLKNFQEDIHESMLVCLKNDEIKTCFALSKEKNKTIIFDIDEVSSIKDEFSNKENLTKKYERVIVVSEEIFNKNKTTEYNLTYRNILDIINETSVIDKSLRLRNYNIVMDESKIDSYLFFVLFSDFVNSYGFSSLLYHYYTGKVEVYPKTWFFKYIKLFPKVIIKRIMGE